MWKTDIKDLEPIRQTPTAWGIPKADSNGKIDVAWLSSTTSYELSHSQGTDTQYYRGDKTWQSALSGTVWQTVMSGACGPTGSAVDAAYTLQPTDASRLVMLQSSNATTVTIPLDSTYAFPTGTQIDFIQTGGGKCTFAGAAGVVLNSKDGKKAIAKQWVGVTLYKVSVNLWILLGDLTS